MLAEAEAFLFFMAFFSYKLVGVALPKWWITRGSTHENGRTLRCYACNINHIIKGVKGFVRLFLRKSFWGLLTSRPSWQVWLIAQVGWCISISTIKRKRKAPWSLNGLGMSDGLHVSGRSNCKKLQLLFQPSFSSLSSLFMVVLSVTSNASYRNFTLKQRLSRRLRAMPHLKWAIARHPKDEQWLETVHSTVSFMTQWGFYELFRVFRAISTKWFWTS